jgi:hypothetical protein
MDGQQLLSSDNNNCLSNGEQYWHGRYSEERIFWKNGIIAIQIVRNGCKINIEDYPMMYKSK